MTVSEPNKKPASQSLGAEPLSVQVTLPSQTQAQEKLKVLVDKSKLSEALKDVLAPSLLRKRCIIHYDYMIKDFYGGDAALLHKALHWPVGDEQLQEDATFWDHNVYSQLLELIVMFSMASSSISKDMNVAEWMSSPQSELDGRSPLEFYHQTGKNIFDIPYHETRVLMEFHPEEELTLEGVSKEVTEWPKDTELDIFWDLLWEAFNDEFSWIFRALGWPKGTYLENEETGERELTQEQRDDLRRLDVFIKHAELYMMHRHEERGYMDRLGQVGEWMVQENPTLGGLSPSQVLAQEKDAGLERLLSTDFPEFSPHDEPTDSQLLLLPAGETVISLIAKTAAFDTARLPIEAGALISAARGVKHRQRIINDIHAAMRYYTPKRTAEQLQADNASILDEIMGKPQPFRRNCLRELKRITPEGYQWEKGDDE